MAIEPDQVMQPSDRPVGSSDIGDRLALAEISLAELQAKYEPVGWTRDGNTLLVTRQMADPPVLDASPDRPSFAEYGSTGQSVWTGVLHEDYNPQLRGRMGLETYDRMRKSDGQVRAVLRLAKTPVLAARWYMEPASQSKRDQRIAKEVWDNITKWMTVSWPQLLSETLLNLDFGYYMFEKVFDQRMVGTRNMIVWRKMAPRHPLDVKQWDFDDHGGPNGVIVYKYDPEGGQTEVYIPIYKLAVFPFDMEAGDLTGISILRSAYKHWFFKENLYKIDAIQKERHGIGVPVIVLPPNADSEDRRLADEIGRNLRANEKAHIVLPSALWELTMLKLEGQPVDIIASVDHHNKMIAHNILAPFLETTGQTSIEAAQEFFLKGTRYIAEAIRDVWNKYNIPQWVNWNYPNVDEYPELRVRRIGDTIDWRTISFAIRNFIGAGVIIPDDQLEEWVRNEMDLPAADPETARIIVPQQQAGQIPDGPPDANPGAGGAGAGLAHGNQGVGGTVSAPGTQTPGLPRQSTAAGSTQGKGPGNTGRVGRDTSGGK